MLYLRCFFYCCYRYYLLLLLQAFLQDLGLEDALLKEEDIKEGEARRLFNKTQRTVRQELHAMKPPHSVSKVVHLSKTSYRITAPDFTKYSPVLPVNKALAPYVVDALRAYPSKSKYINKHHYYNNRNVIEHELEKRQPCAVSLNQLAQYYDDGSVLTKSKILASGRFVKSELIVRLASQLHLLQQLPFGLVNNFHFIQVYESYYNMFDRIRRSPSITDLSSNAHFTNTLNQILRDFNALNLPHLIMGTLECVILELIPPHDIDELVSRLLRARISRRIIAEEHIALTKNFIEGNKNNPSIFGDIFSECSAKEYFENASLQCQKFVQDMYFPSIKLPKFKCEGQTDLKFYFLSDHLKYLLGEILRNSYEASMKHYIRKGTENPSDITVTLIEDHDYITFRISDEAGGLQLRERELWSFGKSKEKARKSLSNFHKLPGLQTVSLYDHLYDKKSIPPSVLKMIHSQYINTALTPMKYLLSKSAEDNTVPDLGTGKPLLGLLGRPFRYKLGIGLAMCKVYADYWDGDLTVHSIDGYGTDTILKLGNLRNHRDIPQLDKF